jgi:hypothetical protein
VLEIPLLERRSINLNNGTLHQSLSTRTSSLLDALYTTSRILVFRVTASLPHE